MSAYGYGSTYMPSWRQNTTPQAGPLAQSASIAPAAYRPNFAPVASSPIATPTPTIVGGYTGHDSSGYESDIKGNYYATPNWTNPLESMFGNMAGSNPNELSKTNSLGSQGVNNMPYTSYMGYAGGDALPGMAPDFSRGQGNRERESFGVPEQIEISRTYNPGTEQMMGDKRNPQIGTGSYQTPGDAKQLYSSLNNLSSDQLMRLSSQGPLGNVFEQTAKAYKNAYANPLYGKRQFGQQESFGGNNLSEAENSDWLQKSYGQLTKRMNDNYLL